MDRRVALPRSKNPYVICLWGVVIPLVLTAIDWPFRELLTPSNILMIYLLGVFFVAIRFGLWPSIVASLTSVADFAFFFAPPIFSFAISDPENLFGVTVMVVVGIVTSKLAENMRTQTRVAEHREHQVSALYQLSKELAEAHLGSEIIVIGVRHIHSEFGGRNTFLLPDYTGKLCYPDESALDISWRGPDLEIARRVFANNQMVGHGIDNFSEDTAVYVPLKGATGTIGVLALEYIDSQQVFPTNQFQFLDTFVDQIVHSLERVNLSEQAKNATLKMQEEALRNSLLSSISHDLRTPLATIIGAATTLETDGNLAEDSKSKLVGAINEEAQRISELTNKILEMARLEAGEVKLNRQ